MQHLVARGLFPCSVLKRAAVVLAEIIDYERDPLTHHHIDSAGVQRLYELIRQKVAETNSSRGLSEAEGYTRIQAITAIGIMGTAADLDLLDRIAATDPTYNSKIQYYPYRVGARLAAPELLANAS